MISSVKISNFQSHGKAELTFSPYVNVIIGKSDAGKSTIIRALRWAIRNRPNGNSIRSHWGGETSVELHTDEGQVSRIKDKTDTYLLVPPNGKTLSFKAFGVKVPEEIENLLDIGEVNLQYQLDAPFLLSSTSGEVAQHFNKVARIDQIDIATSNIKKQITNLNSTIEHKRSDIKKKKEELKKFEYLDIVEASIEVLEMAEDRLRKKRTEHVKLLNLINRYHLNTIDIDKLKEFTQLEPLVDSLLEEYKKLKELKEKSNRLTSLINSSKKLSKRLSRLSTVTVLQEDVDNLLEMYEELASKKSVSLRLSKAIRQYKDISVQLKQNEVKHTRLLKEFQEGMGNVCLLCGQTIKDKHNGKR